MLTCGAGAVVCPASFETLSKVCRSCPSPWIATMSDPDPFAASMIPSMRVPRAWYLSAITSFDGSVASAIVPLVGSRLSSIVGALSPAHRLLWRWSVDFGTPSSLAKPRTVSFAARRRSIEARLG